MVKTGCSSKKKFTKMYIIYQGKYIITINNKKQMFYINLYEFTLHNGALILLVGK